MSKIMTRFSVCTKPLEDALAAFKFCMEYADDVYLHQEVYEEEGGTKCIYFDLTGSVDASNATTVLTYLEKKGFVDDAYILFNHN